MTDRQPERETEYAALDKIGDDMTTDIEYKWGPVNPLPDGHRMFEARKPLANDFISGIPMLTSFHENGLWALCDDSAREPQDTDDGVLFLEFGAALMSG